MRVYYLLGHLLQPFAAAAFFMYSHMFHTPRARLVLKNKNDEVLLVKSWLSGNAWGMPGGGIHKRETAVAAACRELKEETGIVLETQELAPLFTLRSAGHKEIVFIAILTRDDLPTISLRKFEVKDSGWFSLETLPKLETTAAKIIDRMAIKS